MQFTYCKTKKKQYFCRRFAREGSNKYPLTIIKQTQRNASGRLAAKN